MFFSKPKKSGFLYFGEHLLIVIGLVLIWRGVWYVLDEIDIVFFAGNHFWSALVGIVVGLALLYVPDKDLKEIAQH
jgi:uncharacterized membrane protein